MYVELSGAFSIRYSHTPSSSVGLQGRSMHTSHRPEDRSVNSTQARSPVFCPCQMIRDEASKKLTQGAEQAAFYGDWFNEHMVFNDGDVAYRHFYRCAWVCGCGTSCEDGDDRRFAIRPGRGITTAATSGSRRSSTGRRRGHIAQRICG